jgi:hypothetical protein
VIVKSIVGINSKIFMKGITKLRELRFKYSKLSLNN